MTEETFCVHTEDPNGVFTTDGVWRNAEDTVSECVRIINSVLAHTGLIVSMVAVDKGDETVMQWKRDQGLIFPPPPEGKEPYGKWG